MSYKKLLSAIWIALMVIGVAACDKKGPAEQAGERIDNATERAGDKVENAGDKAAEKMDHAADTIENKTDNK